MTELQDVRDKVALVVGGAGAIGKSCAARLAAGGARVVVADLSPARSAAAAQDVRAALGIGVDVTDSRSVSAAVDRVVDELGGLDVAVNVAGVAGPTVRLHEYRDEDWDRVLAINLSGVFRCLRAQVVAMLADGRRGSIINMSSVTGSLGFASAAAYSSSKHGLEGLTRSAALEYAADGIRVNAVAPGFVGTELLTSRRSADEVAELASSHPLNRLGGVAEVAEVVSFLASDRASFVTGACYAVDGGYLAGRPAGR